MSYDFNTLPRPCDHVIQAERLAISLDNRTLYSLDMPTQRMTSVINGTATVQLSINGVVVPPGHPVYGWTIQPDELSWPANSRAKIVFVRPVLGRSLLIRLRYTTLAYCCTKCGGSSKLLDYSLAGNGSFLHITGQPKLIQRILKFILTSVCTFYPTLTCPLKTYIAKKFGRTVTSDDVDGVVRTAMANLQAVQNLQAKYQTLEAAEVLRGVSGVTATQDTKDPRVVHVGVNIVGPAGNTSQVNVGLKAAV